MALGYLQQALQRLASSQDRGMTPQEMGLLAQSQQPTPTQSTLQQMMQPQPMPQGPSPDMMAANNADPYGGVSMQTRKAMSDLGAADPTGEFGDAMINRPKPIGPPGYAAKTTVRGKQLPAQKEQLVKMLMGRGMDEKEARARAEQF